MQVVAYQRVSTSKQEASGLGLEAQREYIEAAAKAEGWDVVEWYVESVSGSVAPEERPVMAQAVASGLPIVVAKLDRIGRDVEHVAALMKRTTIKVATMPKADAFQLHLFAALAEQERQFIRQRTKDALEALSRRAKSGCEVSKAKVARRAESLSKGRTAASVSKARESLTSNANAFAESIRPDFESCLFRGCNTLQSMADCLNGRKVATARGCEWTPIAASRLMKRLNLAF
ncbi:recombinase family protein [Pseudomonas aeruginosa]|uniref:recombinase family protein n=1 Tax=Pseudomonas aeruginosa TaxID=287 RepID=UPI0031B6AFBA